LAGVAATGVAAVVATCADAGAAKPATVNMMAIAGTRPSASRLVKSFSYPCGRGVRPRHTWHLRGAAASALVRLARAPRYSRETPSLSCC
jgi:hypothetical protein